MILKKLMNIEESLLKINEYCKNTLSFNEIVLLKRYMQEISEITNVYFELIDGYNNNDIEDYSKKILATTIDDIINHKEITSFLEKIKEKYLIDF